MEKDSQHNQHQHRENDQGKMDVDRQVGTIFGRNEADIERRLDEMAVRHGRHYSVAELRDSGMVVGDGQQIREQLDAYAAAGVQRIMLQWLDLDDLDGLEALAGALLDQPA